MSNYYCDHGAYSTVLGATPIWGVPQEGDGSATAAASTAGTAAIVFSANCAVGAAVTICGVVFTAVASGATGNQFNVGAALTNSIDNLVTAINASTTAVAAGVAIGLPQMRNLVFARNTAGTTIEVMMRVGSTQLNGATNTNCRMTCTTWATGSSLPVNFAGGAGGCWGWLINPAAIGVSSTYAAGTYGIFGSVLPIITGTNALPTDLDTIWGRSGAGKTITMATGVGISASADYAINFVLDSNTKWTGDSGTGQVTFSFSISGADVLCYFNQATGAGKYKSWGCIKKGALRFYLRSASSGGALRFRSENASAHSHGRVWNALFEEYATCPASQGMYVYTNNYTSLHFENCRFANPAPRTAFPTTAFANLTLVGKVSFIGCKFEFNFTNLTDPGPLISANVAATRCGIRVEDCEVTGWTSGTMKAVGSLTAPNNANWLFRNNKGLLIDASTYAGMQTPYGNEFDEFTGRMVFYSADVGGTFREETAIGVCDWVYGANYPVLKATQPDGTVWSIKMDWLTTSGLVSSATPFRSIPLTQYYRATADTKTITLELLVPDAVTLTADMCCMTVRYINSSGSPVTETTLGAVAPSASGLSWSLNGLTGYSPKKLAITTAQAIKQNTAIQVTFELHRRTSVNRQIYVDPEFSMT